MSSNGVEQDATGTQASKRSNSFSNQSDSSQTAAEYVNAAHHQFGVTSNVSRFIRSQELLEADAREALPFVRLRVNRAARSTVANLSRASITAPEYSAR